MILNFIQKYKYLLIFILGYVVVFSVYIASLDPESETTPLNIRKFVTTIQDKILNRPKDDEVTLILGGDVMLGRTVMTKSLDEGNTNYPFEKVGEKIKEADLVYVNLENPIIDNCQRHYEGLIFCALPSMLDGLTNNEINIVNLANNHTLNYGQSGLDETVKHLTERNISYAGLGNLTVKEVKGTKFGFVGYDFLKDEDYEKFKGLVERSDELVDVLVVAAHWGAEYAAEPNKYQKSWAKDLVDLGADVIVGHHPHWVQSSEKIDRPAKSDGSDRAPALVYYSLGNLVFDQMWSTKTREGLVMKLTFKGKELVKEEELPIYMDNWAQPEFVEE